MNVSVRTAQNLLCHKTAMMFRLIDRLGYRYLARSKTSENQTLYRNQTTYHFFAKRMAPDRGAALLFLVHRYVHTFVLSKTVDSVILEYIAQKEVIGINPAP